MKRSTCTPRPGFAETIRKQGLIFDMNSDGTPYWDESVYYSFTTREIELLHAAAEELHQMFLAAAEHVLAQKDGLARLGIPLPLHDVIRRSWDADEWEFYGRFDLTFDSRGVPKLIEYNADTPTGLIEAAVIQWYWKEDRFPRLDQFNSIHESLVGRWEELIRHGQVARVLTHFTSVDKHPEDRITIGYLACVAEEAGLETSYLPVDRIGWDRASAQFVDDQVRAIRQIVKLYPWEWMGEEAFAPQLGLAHWKVLEPAWKAILASKKLLVVMQELYPGHPNLLQVSEKPLPVDHVAKPAFGREGSIVTFYQNGAMADRREGRDDLGSLEDGRPILGNTSRFVPHVIA